MLVETGVEDSQRTLLCSWLKMSGTIARKFPFSVYFDEISNFMEILGKM